MNYKELEKKLDDYLSSEEGRQSIIHYRNKLEQSEKVKERWINRLNSSNISVFIEKVINKYTSDKYINRWYSRNIEPPEDLYWLIFEYAKKYGKKPTPRQISDYYNIFTVKAYRVNNYIIQQMNGQGSVIRIDKIK